MNDPMHKSRKNSMATQPHVERPDTNKRILLLLRFTGPPVPITARMHSPPQTKRPDTIILTWCVECILAVIAVVAVINEVML
eukprot:4455323-Pyramimonas_sp.AAC.1